MKLRSFGARRRDVAYLVLSAGLASLAAPALARDTRLVLPINQVLRQPATRDALGNDVQLRFSSEPRKEPPQGRELKVESYARPYSKTQRYGDGRPVIRSDEETCMEAMRNTLVELVEAAKEQGVKSVTQIESFYDGNVLTTPGAYECHAGSFSAVVQLRGLAGTDGAVAPPEAAIDDVNAVPGLSAEGRAAYRKFLQSKPPRAFVIRQAAGHTWYGWADGSVPKDITRPSDPSQRALEYCRENSQGECTLYAVDYAVVYQKPTASVPTQQARVAGAATNRYALPAESNFGDVNDASIVPVRQKDRDQYFKFLALPTPRAFAIASDGSAALASGSAAMADVLNNCEREGKTCWLYAVDERVVWQRDLRQRIGKVNQLSRIPQGASAQ